MAVSPGETANGAGKTHAAAAPKVALGPAALTISGCIDDVVGPIIRGTYSLHSENHSKPVYRKDEQVGAKRLEVMLYFWHDSDSPDFSGWWFGPKLGGDQVWAFHPDFEALSPPSDGWQCPFDGPVDSTILVCPRAVSSQAGSAKPHKEEKPKVSRPAEPTTRQKLDEAEQRRREQKAVLAVARIVQKLKLAKPENLEALLAEREAVLAAELPHAAGQRTRLQAEADKALALAKQRVELIHTQLEKANEDKEVRERSKKDKEAKTQELCDELERLVEVAEESLKSLTDVTSSLRLIAEGSEATEFKQVEACTQRLAAVDDELVKAHKLCADFIAEKRSAIDQGPPRKEARKAQPLVDRTEAVLRQRSALLREFEQLRLAAEERQKALQEAAKARNAAQAYVDSQKALFTKYDVDRDGKLDRREIQAYSKGAFSFEVPMEDVERLLRELAFHDASVAVAKGVEWKHFQRLQVTVGIAREIARDRKRGAEKQEHLAALSQRFDSVKDAMVDIEASVQEIREQVTKRGSLRPAQELTSIELQAVSEEVGALIAEAEAKIADAHRQVEAAVLQQKSPSWMQHELDSARRAQAAEISVRTVKLETSLRYCQNLRNGLRTQAQLKNRQEGETIHLQIVETLRSAALEARSSGAHEDAELELPPELRSSDGKVSCETLTDFVRSRDPKLSIAAVSPWLSSITSSGAAICEDLQQLLRLCYKVTKTTVLTNAFGIKDSIAVRRLDVDEVFEVIGTGIPREEDSGATRLYGRAVRDSLLGYATVRGNQGTIYLERGGNSCTVLKETSLTTTLLQNEDSTEGEIRKLKPGEIIDVLVQDTKDEASGNARLKVRARSDSAVGWASRANSDCILNLKPC